MYKRNSTGLSVFLSLFVAVFLIMPFISSCGKGSNVAPSTLNIQYDILNLSPNLGSIDFYINYGKVNSSSYFYPNSSGYFYLTSVTNPFQIRPGSPLVAGSVAAPDTNIFSRNDTLQANTRYTWIITGLHNANYKLDSVYQIFLIDTASIPALGRGKVRFVNASPRTTTGLDITANDTSFFTKVAYTKYTTFRELPAGTYDFKIYATGSSAVVRDIPNVTIQDGRLYTLYTYGLVGHTDSLAFGSGFITNK